MKKVLFVLICSIIYALPSNAQLLKKLTEKIKEGTIDAYSYTKNSISEAIEFGKIKSILREVKGNNFTKAYELLNEFKEKYPSNDMYYYMAYLVYESDDSKYKNYDLAFQNLNKLNYTNFRFYDGIDVKEREKLLNDYNFCKDSLFANYNHIQLKLLLSLNSDEFSISRFISNYPNSVYLDSAIKIRHQIRYDYATKLNTLYSYTSFISNNQDARQINDAKYNQSLLAYKKAEQDNTEDAFSNFIRNYSGQQILDNKAKLKIKYLKLNKINSDYAKIMSKYKSFFKEFTFDKYADESTDGINFTNIISKYSSNSEYFYNGDKITYSLISDGKIKFNSMDVFKPLITQIASFSMDYPGTTELITVNNIKTEIDEIKAKIDFYNISRYWIGIDAYNRYSKTYPNSHYAIIVENRKEILEKRKKREEDIAIAKEEAARAKAEETARLERERAEQAAQAEANAVAEEKRKKDQESNILFQVAKRLNPADKKLLLDILDDKVDTDPHSRVGNRCGTGYSSCKWCGRQVSFEKTYQSRVQMIKMFALGSPMIGALLPMAQLFAQMGGILSGGKPKNISNEKMMSGLTNEIRGYLSQIRNGNYYSCEGGSGDMFCSLRCQNEYKFRR